MSPLPAALGAAAVAATLAHGRRPRRRLGLQPAPVVARFLFAVGGVSTVVAWRFVGGSPGRLLAVAASAGFVLPVLRARTRRRRRACLEADVVAMCFGTAAELRAGRSPGEALDTVGAQLGPLCDGMRALARAVRRGAQVDDELRALAVESGSPRLRTVAAVWTAGASTGAGVADVLERVGQAFAADDEARAELGALAAAPRATALVLCALPVFALGLGAATGAHPAALLLGSPFGWLLTVVAAVLDLSGVLWVRAITHRAMTG